MCIRDSYRGGLRLVLWGLAKTSFGASWGVSGGGPWGRRFFNSFCSRRSTGGLGAPRPVSYTHLRAHETSAHL
eukprot:5045545-Alexandrium_andersonii.AAC.1